MIVDTSAIIAIALEEPERNVFRDHLQSGHQAVMSAATYVETFVVARRRGGQLLSDIVERVFADGFIDVVPVSVRQAHYARDAFIAYGRGSGHPARLNFGDCFTYALAAELDQPILCKGDDFVHTDRAVLPMR